MTCPVKMNDSTPCPPECAKNEPEPTFREVVKIYNSAFADASTNEQNRLFALHYMNGDAEEVIELYNQIRRKINQPDRSER